MGLAFYGICFGSWENMALNEEEREREHVLAHAHVLEHTHTHREKTTMTVENYFPRHNFLANQGFQVHVITTLCDLKKNLVGGVSPLISSEMCYI